VAKYHPKKGPLILKRGVNPVQKEGFGGKEIFLKKREKRSNRKRCGKMAISKWRRRMGTEESTRPRKNTK